MLKRRDVLILAAGGLATRALPHAVAPAFAQTASAPAPAAEIPPQFDWSSVVEQARGLSKRPYKAPSADLPDAFANLTYDQYVAIRNRPGKALWVSENTGYAIEPLHRGFLFTAPMQIS